MFHYIFRRYRDLVKSTLKNSISEILGESENSIEKALKTNFKKSFISSGVKSFLEKALPDVSNNSIVSKAFSGVVKADLESLAFGDKNINCFK